MYRVVIQNKEIKLNLSEKVFTPSSTSLFVAQNFKVRENETVFDIGCGTGILGILAHKLGAKSVAGSDTNKFAVELARKNAEINNITNYNSFLGDFFGNDRNKYDVIVTNIPQTPIPPEFDESEWALDVDGGADGTEKICKVLELAKDRLSQNGGLYVPIVYFSNPRKTLDLLKRLYRHKKISEREMPIDFKILSRLPYFLKLKEEDKCEIYQKADNIWYTKEELYELTPK